MNPACPSPPASTASARPKTSSTTRSGRVSRRVQRARQRAGAAVRRPALHLLPAAAARAAPSAWGTSRWWCRGSPSGRLVRDPPERSIPVCTLKNFPNEIAHTIQWSRDLFEGAFRQSAEDVNAYLSQPDFLASLERQPGVRHTTLNDIKTNLVEKPIALEACVVWARLKFEELFHNRRARWATDAPHRIPHRITSLTPPPPPLPPTPQIAQLIHTFPLDMVTASGAPFWSGPKRPPTPLRFDTSDPLHLDFVVPPPTCAPPTTASRGRPTSTSSAAPPSAMVPSSRRRRGRRCRPT